ncbi:DUF1579 domain-containing protein [Brevundimonas sp. 2R-24]|uniref:DUF1579 domain-containing protein n=1 Tax=Peiella sedimenti TaxID=3061083 RepID=A0ABT8SI81_9CAUL|nr:DUF1579 domain-containing protein [Caulobacteraceae bacterium XZ-24]
MHRRIFVAAVIASTLGMASPGLGQSSPPAGPAGSQAQRDAIAALSFMDGEWRGTATTYGREGPVTLIQTERVGPLLGGSVRVVEGRGYAEDGSTQFNALGIISWDERAGAYRFRAYAQGFSGDYPFERTENGFRWRTPAGPNAEIRYEATIQDGEWHEVGHYVAEGQPPRPYVELRLRRVGDTDWPGAGAVATR